MDRHDAKLIAEELFKLQSYEEPYIDIKAAAEYLSMSTMTIYQNEDIPRYKIGSSVRFRKSALDKWISSQN